MKNNKFLLSIFVASLITSYIQANTLTITQAYKLALENDNGLKSLEYQFKSNQENINQIEASLYPQINATIISSKTDYEINNLQFRTDYDVSEKSTDYGISLNQVIYNEDLSTKIEMEKTKISLSKLTIELKKQELSKKVIQLYIDILQAKNRIKLYESYTKFNKYRLDAIQKRYDMNLANKMDLLQMQVDYNSSKIDLSKEKEFFKIYKLKFKKLIGNIPFELSEFNFNKLDMDKIKKMQILVEKIHNFSSNINVQQANMSKKLASQGIDNAYSGHMPTLNIDAKYTKFDSDDISTDYENSQKIMLQLKIPIYHGGSVESKVISSTLIKKATDEDLLKSINDTKIQYGEHIVLFNASVESLTLYKEALDSANLYYEAISMGFDNGLKSIIELNEAKNKLYEVKYKYIKNIYEMIDSYAGLLILINRFDGLELVDDIIN